ncbi:universal stress protein [Actinomadura cremea]|nr:universal stress protein [Actinomadura cremea]
MSDENSSAAIVVGVDGSPASLDALRWAARQAELTGAELRAVSAWRLPSFGYPIEYVDEEVEGAVDAELGRAVREALGETPRVPVSRVVVQGHPAPVLVEQSENAELLVVGSHGRGAFAGMLLGSVSAHCVHHARCPVVVVRHPAADSAHGGDVQDAPPVTPGR